MPRWSYLQRGIHSRLFLVQLCIGYVVAVDLEPIVQALAVGLDARHTSVEHGDGSVSNPLTALVENALEFFQLVLIRDVLLDDAHVGDANAAVGKVEGCLAPV